MGARRGACAHSEVELVARKRFVTGRVEEDELAVAGDLELLGLLAVCDHGIRVDVGHASAT